MDPTPSGHKMDGRWDEGRWVDKPAAWSCLSTEPKIEIMAALKNKSARDVPAGVPEVNL